MLGKIYGLLSNLRTGLRWLVLAGWLHGALHVQAFAQDPYALPPLPGHVVDEHFFGTHLHALVLRGRVQEPPQATPFPNGLVGAVRLWDSAVRWAEVEPQDGRFVFERMDAYVNTSIRNGARVVLTLGSTPRWASARPDEPCSYGFGCSAEPANMAHWDRYVQTLAQRYKGRIFAYEVWNEPHPGQRFEGHRGFFTGDLPTLIELSRRTHQVLRREDPQSLLLTPGFVNRLPLLERYLAEGGAQWAQGLAYHLYASGDRQLLDQLRTLRGILARQGLSHWPLYNTESSFDRSDPKQPATPQAPWRDDASTAALHVRSLILGAFAGAKGWFHHSWDRAESGMVDRQLQPTATHGPYVAVRQWLLGMQPAGCSSFTPEVARCVGMHEGRPVWLLWRMAPGPAIDLMLDAPGSLLAWQEAGQKRVSVGTESRPAAAGKAGHRISVGYMPVAVWWSAP
jgi:hypothetical protein